MKVYDTLKNEMFTYTENGIRSFKNLDFGKTGLYEGEGSIVYAYLCLYKRSNEQIYLQYAEKHAQIVRKLLKQDQRYDVKRDRDVELLKDELEEQIVHLLPQEQINFGFMNGYGGILYKRSYDTNATKNHIELI